jgi:HEAT repeat protein
MTSQLSVRIASAALAAILATACASTEKPVAETSQVQPSMPEGPLGLMVESLLYGAPEERLRAAMDIAEQGPRARDAAPFLIQVLESGEPAVRAEAARALSLIDAQSGPTVAALIEALSSETDEDVLQSLSEALGRIGEPALKGLVRSLEMGEPVTRRLCALSLGIMGQDGESAAPDLILALRDADPDVRAAAAWAIGRVANASPESVQPLVRALDDDEAEVRAAAACALGEFGDRARWTALSLVNKLKDEDASVRREAARSLGRMGPSAAQATLDLQSTAEFDTDEGVRREASEALRQIRQLDTEAEAEAQQ